MTTRRRRPPPPHKAAEHHEHAAKHPAKPPSHEAGDHEKAALTPTPPWPCHPRRLITSSEPQPSDTHATTSAFGRGRETFKRVLVTA